MRKVSVFNFMSLDGYYKSPDGDFSWHQHDAEGQEFSVNNMKTEHILLFGRVTYQIMSGFWPTQQAIQSMRDVANGMNRAEKIVFSNTLKTADWQNTRVMCGDIVEQIRQVKNTPGPDMTILGSGTILTQFAEAGLIDTYQFMVDPLVLGEGVSIFKNLALPLKLKLTDSKVFKNGCVVLNYEPR